MRRLLAVALTVFVAFTFSAPASADQVRDLQYWIQDLGFEKAWQSSEGEGVLVAIIDTGIDATHPDLVGQVVGGKDVSGLGTPDGLTPVGEYSYHGTMVASLLAGTGQGSDTGVKGAAPKAKLLSVSMAFGVDGLDTDKQLAEGIHWAVDQGAKVINLSLTRNTTNWPTIWDEAFLYAFDHDVVIVAAAGNRGDGTERIAAPATIPGVIAVGGLDRNGKASISSSSGGFTLSVSAPSEDLVAAYPGGQYRLYSGTSAAAPLVAGEVALIRSKFPKLSANDVIARVIQSADSASNFSPETGYGAINPQAALNGDFVRSESNPLGDLREWVELYRSSSEVSIAQMSAPGPQPIQLGEATRSNPFDSIWLPIAGYAGVGLLALFLYFAFRPARREENSSIRK